MKILPIELDESLGYPNFALFFEDNFVLRKICSAIGPTSDRVTLEACKASKCHQECICAFIVNKFQMNCSSWHARKYYNISFFRPSPIESDVEQPKHVKRFVEERGRPSGNSKAWYLSHHLFLGFRTKLSTEKCTFVWVVLPFRAIQ